MKAKWFMTAVTVIALGGAASADNVWNGAAGNGLWSDGGNWSQGVAPATGQGNIILNDQTNGSLITIDSATVASVDGDIFGPEWGMDLDIDGGSLTQLSPGFVFAPIGGNEAGRSIISVMNGGSLTVQELLVGDNWWIVDATGSAQPYVTLNVYDTSTVTARGWCWLGGAINLYDGTVDINGGFNMGVNTGGIGVTSVDLYDGELIIRATGVTDRDFYQEALGWESSGYLKAFGGAGSLVYDTETIEGGLIISAVVPEPATLALLGLGGMAVLRARKRG